MSKPIEFLGYFMATGFLVTLIVIAAPITTSILGRENLWDVVVLLVVLYIVSFLALRGENVQEKFHYIVRVTMIVVFLEMILIGGGILIRLLRLSDIEAFLAPLVVIFIYEAFKMGRRMRIAQPQKIQKPKFKEVKTPPQIEMEELVERRKKKKPRTSLVSSLRRRRGGLSGE
jgi:hypothetical protein